MRIILFFWEYLRTKQRMTAGSIMWLNESENGRKTQRSKGGENMAKNEAKIRFTAETGEFNDQVKQSNAEMSKLRAEMKLNDEQMKSAGVSVEGLEQKQKLLEEQLTASRQKTEALSQKVQKAAEIYGENSEEVTKLQTQLLTAQTAEERLQRQISTCNDQLENQRAAANKVETATEQLNNRIKSQQEEVDKLKDEYKEAVLKFGAASDEAKELAEQIDIASGQLKENKKAMSDASSAADDLDKSLDNASDNDGGGFTVFKGALADLISNGIQFAIGKVNELVDYMWGLPEATREIRQDFATLTTAFDNMGYSNQVATETWKGLYAVFGEDDRAVEAANNIAKIAENEQDLNNWVTITTGIWGTYQDSLPVEGLAEAANETAKVGTVTGGLADALNWSSEAAVMFADYMSEDVVTAEDAFNEALKECSTEQERQRLITDTLTKLYGGAAETYRETSGAMYEAKEATAEQILAENNLATAMEPVTTEWQNLKNELLTGIQPAIETVSGLMTDALGWMREHPTATKAIAAAVSVLAIGITGLATAWGIYTIAQWAANSAMLASPITWIILAIVAAVAALVAIIVVVIDKWDEIVAAVQGAVEKMKEVLSTIGDWINENVIQPVVNFFKGLIDWVKENWQTILTFLINPFAGLFKYFYENNTKFKEFVDNAITFIKELPAKVWTWLSNTIQKVTAWTKDMISKAKETATNFVQNVVNFIKELPSNVWTWLVNVVSKVGQWAGNLAAKGKEAATKLVNTIVDTIKNLPTKMVSIGKNLVEGIWKGISNSYSWIKGKIKTWVGNVTDFIKNLFGIKSPSTVMRDEVGRQLAAGVAEGISKNTKLAKKSAEELAKETVDAASKKLENYKVYNDMTLAEEVGFWDEIRKTCAEGTEARINADKKYFEAKKSYDEQIVKAEEELQKQLEEIDKKIADKKNSLLSKFSLTEKLTFEEAATPFEMIGVLDSSVNQLEEYNEVMTSLKSKIGGTAFYDYVKEMGVDDLSTLQSLNDATDMQLQYLVTLYDERQTLADEIAQNQLIDETAIETQEAYANYAAALSGIGAEIVNGGQATSTAGQIVAENLQLTAQAIIGAVETLKQPFEELSKYGFFDGTPDFLRTNWRTKSNDDLTIKANATEIEKNSSYNSFMQAIYDLANRPIVLDINGQKFATATAGDTDAVNGSRMQLSKRGLAR